MSASSSTHFSLNKRDRLDKKVVRRRMLDVAAEYITDTGLTVSLEHISFEAVIQSAEVPRSAVYRLWPRKEDFFEDLLRELAGQKWHGTAVLDERYFHEALLAALEYEDQLDTEEGRRRALLNAARAGIERDFEHLASSASWRTYVALAATVLSLPEGQLKNDLQYELQESEALITNRFANYYMTLSRQVGFKLRDEFGTDYSILATAGASIVEGFALRGVISPQVAAGIDTGHSVLPLSAFRDYAGHGSADEWIMDRYAEALLDYVDEMLDSGMHRTYQRRERQGYFPRGRIEFGRTAHRYAARGIPNKAVSSWHERTIDTAINRCVKAAMEVIHTHLTDSKGRRRKGARHKLARLSGQFHAFSEVGDDPQMSFLDDMQVSGLAPLPESRDYYRPLLDLSTLILQGMGIALEIGGDDVRINSLLINTSELFEKFVRVSLSKYAAGNDWPVEVLDGNTEGRISFYDVPDIPPEPLGTPLLAAAMKDAGKAQPDVVIRTFDGNFVLIAEVKNTITSDGALPERTHVEQAVTYALRYGLQVALLIHPWNKGAKGLIYIGRVRSIDVYDYRLDLSNDKEMDSSLENMAKAVYALAGLNQLG